MSPPWARYQEMDIIPSLRLPAQLHRQLVPSTQWGQQHKNWFWWWSGKPGKEKPGRLTPSTERTLAKVQNLRKGSGHKIAGLPAFSTPIYTFLIKISLPPPDLIHKLN